VWGSAELGVIIAMGGECGGGEEKGGEVVVVVGAVVGGDGDEMV